ncbi:methionine--tRNA ligase [Enterobacteriaceae endosymbiont of Macroplea appendiculata]|uniref:methionine--tRNA ligase n=1 Tax=Enterobacteriaceae endosymbiont of Macroplea appendiculata TaxID=2675790 RepID=UPI00144919CC|nr:methionine--tRNA ligase [Enterobacteriaceae endosymbiont of Macroplea appendiculata]QJC30652.1 methionine--tRNA ligase [Enterobacteriaceae endosymbiont of Macroplea appendiculata]
MKKIKFRKMLVTCALPYANGPIHLGHMLEHIQADIWVRYNRMIGNEVYFICADDAHGTPIMLKAQELKITPVKMIQKIYQQHIDIFKKFYISYDHYHTTHSNENYFFVQLIFKRLKKQKYILKKTVKQLFDKQYNMFLPDRLVQGTCPHCKTIKQYGDYCEQCGSYTSIHLIDPISIVSNTVPIIKQSEHYFFNLPCFYKMLLSWISSDVLDNNIKNKVLEWFHVGLKLWDITRDKPYFGFNILDDIDKFFYVWLDAPIGYISAFKHFCDINKHICFYEWWKTDTKTELYHFIGKDIIYFHSLFWPAILEGSFFRKPTKIFVHGHVTLNGMKMSKSKKTFITALELLNYVNADSLRYYFASKISNNIDDIDFSLHNITYKINSDIVNKIVNIASRTAYFINTYFHNNLSVNINLDIYLEFINKAKIMHYYYTNRQFSHVINMIIILTDIANSYIDTHKPWLIIKNQPDITHNVCSLAINMFRVIMIYLKPIVPNLSYKTEIFLKDTLCFKKLSQPLVNHKINKFFILFQRIKIKNINKIF